MFEYQSFSKLMGDMLKNIPDSMDKREGSVIWDALAPCAAAMSILYASIDEFITESFADTASRPFLIRRANERGLNPFPATYSVLKAVITPAECEIPVGEKFTHNNLFFTVEEKMENGVYKIICDTLGEEGNIPKGDLYPTKYIEGFRSACIDEILIPAHNQEETEVFRKRYFDSFNNIAFGGNIADYIAKTKAINGVGAVKIIPHWQGGGTVKVIFLDSMYSSPSHELIKTVKDILDPEEHSGKGYGIAPIGHVVTVEGAGEIPINISCNFTLEPGFTFEDVKSDVEKAVSEYFLSLVKTWEESNELIIRLSGVEYAILSCDGILDIENTLMNGSNKNILLSANEIPVKGDIADERT